MIVQAGQRVEAGPHCPWRVRGSVFAARCPFFPAANCETHQQPRLSQWSESQPRPDQPKAGDRGDHCNRFCGLAARWNANVQTMVLPRVALTAEEVAAAAGQQATVFQELAPALVEIRQPIVLGFPSAQALRRFFAARRERPLAA